MLFLAIVDKSEYISIPRAIGIALNSMLIVFGILVLIWLSVVLIKYVQLPRSNKPKDDQPVKNQPTITKSVEIKDDDMMAAVLAATIDFNKETGKDAKLISVREL
ncbi:MAG: OadG family protein [Bacilli bacterium]|jgi:hypothetical protein|nr:OadG family protein [Acholeplasmataceae bacterium]